MYIFFIDIYCVYLYSFIHTPALEELRPKLNAKAAAGTRGELGPQAAWKRLTV